LYIPIDEDFWMSPVESMASWKPVIWVNEWWLKETIIDGKTWILIPRDFILDDLIQAIESLDKKKALSMKNDCEKRAYDFSIETFQKQLQEYISSV
jgi:glycosyltransferase involved in cell wall biosynthesis